MNSRLPALFHVRLPSVCTPKSIRLGSFHLVKGQFWWCIYIYPIIYRYGCGIYIYICISHFHTSPIILPGMSRVLVENGIFSKELFLALHRFSDQWCLGLRHRASMKIRYKKYSLYQAQTGLIWWFFVSAAWLSTITIVYVDIFTKYIEIGRYIQSYIYIYICTIIHIYIFICFV